MQVNNAGVDRAKIDGDVLFSHSNTNVGVVSDFIYERFLE